MKVIKNRRGVSVVAVVIMMLMMAAMGAVLISLVATENTSSMGQMSGGQSFYIAEGGLEYGKMYLRPYADLYSFSTDPIIPASGKPLGSGNFTTTINFPATDLSRSVGNSNTTICVRTKDQFPTTFPFYLELNNPDEYVQCTANNGASCYTCARGVLGSSGTAHSQNTEVDPVVQLSATITATDTTIPFTGSPSKFLSRGTIFIDDLAGNEEISYGAIQTAPQAFINCIRGVNGTTAVGHTFVAPGFSIVPLQSTQQAFLQSTGLRSTILGSSAQRVLTDVINK